MHLACRILGRGDSLIDSVPGLPREKLSPDALGATVHSQTQERERFNHSPMLRRYYQSVGHRLEFFGWGRNIVGHIRRHSFFYENFEALFTALLLALIIKRYIVEAYKIPSRSMMNTLLVNDRIFVNKFCYLFQDIKPGDVVVFKVPTDIPNYDPEKPYYIKRVVGVAGDQIEIDSDHHIYRNGKMLVDPPFFDENPYFFVTNQRSFSMNVPEGHILTFGDNSRDSYDGRYWGPLPIENVMGKAFFRYWPIHPWRVGPIQNVSVTPRHSSDRAAAGAAN